MKHWLNSASSRTDDPQPRLEPLPAKLFDWPVTARYDCAPLCPPPEQSFVAVLESRRSDRQMRQAPLNEVANVLGFATRPRYWKEGDSFGRSRRPTISAGALHPISVLIIPAQNDRRLLRYDALQHQLEELRSDAAEVGAFFRRCAELLPEANGSALVLVADFANPSAVYERVESLLWRDAGALLQTVAIVCTAYKLNFCPLGLLGSEVVLSLGAPQQLLAVGTALIGRGMDAPRPPL